MSSCGTCGEPLGTDERFCGECGSPVAQRCQACGSPLTPGKKFCTACGAAAGGCWRATRAGSGPGDRRRRGAPRRLGDLLRPGGLHVADPESPGARHRAGLLSGYFDDARAIISRQRRDDREVHRRRRDGRVGGAGRARERRRTSRPCPASSWSTPSTPSARPTTSKDSRRGWASSPVQAAADGQRRGGDRRRRPASTPPRASRRLAEPGMVYVDEHHSCRHRCRHLVRRRRRRPGEGQGRPRPGLAG